MRRLIIAAAVIFAIILSVLILTDSEGKIDAAAIAYEREVAENHQYCRSAVDCEWVDCGCFNKERNRTIRCLFNLTEKDCDCMQGTCVPDILSSMSGNMFDLKKYLRRAAFKPECPKFDYLFFTSVGSSDTALLVLSMKGLDSFDSFLDNNCDKPFLRSKFDSALGGDHFHPCNGLDFVYGECASFESAGWSDWADSKKGYIEAKGVECEADFQGCSGYSSAIKRVERRASFERSYEDVCGTDCSRILAAKSVCESQYNMPWEFKEAAYDRLLLACDARSTSLDKARRIVVDEELALDLLGAEIRSQGIIRDVDRYVSRDPLSRIMDWFSRLLGGGQDDAEEVDSMLENIDYSIKELIRLNSSSDNGAVREGIADQISRLESRRELLVVS